MPKLKGQTKAKDLYPHYVGGLCGVKPPNHDKYLLGSIVNLYANSSPAAADIYLVTKVYSKDTHLWSGEETHGKLDDKERYKIDFPETGFVNSGESSALYFKRMPRRQWLFVPKLGTNANIQQIDTDVSSFLNPEAARVQIKDRKALNVMSDLYNRHFPSFEEIYDDIKLGKRFSGAFALHWAMFVASGISVPLLSYKGKYTVGMVHKKDSVMLSNNATALAETLEYTAPVRITYA